MEKEKRILFYFIGWFIVAFCIFLIGVINADAATYYMNYQYSQQYYDNNGSSVTAVSTTWNESLQSYVSNNITTVSGSYGAGLSITSPIPIISNHTYTISIYFEGISNLALSSKNNIAISTSLGGASYNYANGDYWVDTLQSKVNNNTVLQFVFTAKGAAGFIFIPWTTTSTTSQSYVLTQIVMEDLGSEGISQNQINTSLTNQTNEINTSIQNSTNTITGAIGETENNINSNIDDMEQSIIDSNKETQETIKDQFNECRDSVNLLNVPNVLFVKGTSPKVISLNLDPGTYTFSASKIESNKIEEKLFLFYLPEQQLYLKLSPYTLKTTYTFNAPITQLIIYSSNGYDGTVDTTFYDLMLVKGSSVPSSYEPYGEEICSNRIDETNDKLDNLQDSITDSSSPDIDGLADSAGWLPPGPLDSVLNLPLSLFNSLTINLNKSCSPISIPLPYVNKNLTIPCINTLYDKIGVSTFITWLGVIVSGLMLYTYLLKLYKWIEDRISLNETHSVDNWGGL